MTVEEVIVRMARHGDASAIAAVYAPIVENTVISFEEEPPDTPEILRRMQAMPRLPWLVAEHGEQVVGFAYAAAHRKRAAYRWSVDFSVYLDARHRGRGVGRRLYERLIEEVGPLGYVAVFAGIALPNPASVALHEALGFEPVGTFRHVGYKHGAWHDVSWWQRLQADPPSAPAEPREWPGYSATAAPKES